MPRAENRKNIFSAVPAGRAFDHFGGANSTRFLDKLSAARPRWARRRVLQRSFRIPSP